jgi:RimJ/RimL family protein N-acetyltransferase
MEVFSVVRADSGTNDAVIVTERLLMREVRRADAPFVLEFLTDAKVLRYIGDRGIRTVEGSEAYIEEKIRGSYREHGYGMWLVVERSSDRAVGMCGLVNREFLEDVDVGYGFLQAHAGQGFATEAAAAVMAYAHRSLAISRLVAITSIENDASIRVLEKLGLQFDSIIEFPGDPDGARLFVPIVPAARQPGNGGIAGRQ